MMLNCLFFREMIEQSGRRGTGTLLTDAVRQLGAIYHLFVKLQFIKCLKKQQQQYVFLLSVLLFSRKFHNSPLGGNDNTSQGRLQ